MFSLSDTPCQSILPNDGKIATKLWLAMGPFQIMLMSIRQTRSLDSRTYERCLRDIPRLFRNVSFPWHHTWCKNAWNKLSERLHVDAEQGPHSGSMLSHFCQWGIWNGLKWWFICGSSFTMKQLHAISYDNHDVTIFNFPSLHYQGDLGKSRPEAVAFPFRRTFLSWIVMTYIEIVKSCRA